MENINKTSNQELMEETVNTQKIIDAIEKMNSNLQFITNVGNLVIVVFVGIIFYLSTLLFG